MEMIMNNETEKVSRKRKRRIERKNKFDDIMKLLLKKLKQKRKRKKI